MARSGRYRSRTWCACGPGSVAPTRSEQRAAADFAAVLERGGRSTAGPALRVALVEAVDAWLAELLGDAGAGVALVATGPYGRREPAPCSDLDLMLLHDRGTEEIAPLAERLWRPIWDAGMRLDHSVRTVDEALAVAATDLKTALGLLDARHVAGDGALVASLRERALERWRATARERLEQLRAACQRRAERHGELAFLLEPDLKEARGGLRDGLAVRAISATWVAAGLDRRGQAAYGLLLDTRQALHLELLEQGGVMDALLPEWERVRCKPQHNPFHRWTVDRHLVETAVHAAALVRRVGRPDLLLLAALLHDLGKGWPGDHAVTGARLAATVGTRLGLPTGD